MNYKILDSITKPSDLKKLDIAQLYNLCDDIRSFLVTNIAKTGGHLSSNLGAVELTVAIHKVFNSPSDKIFWDVGHQCYTHKILTGRKNEFYRLRKKDGLSGYPKPSESEHDCFVAGHSSTSVSAAIGHAYANILNNNRAYSIAVIGDGSLTGGQAYEALNNCPKSDSGLIVILNHNKMSISKNVGAFASYLSTLRSKKLYNKLKSDITVTLVKIPIIGKPLYYVLNYFKNMLKLILCPTTFFENMGYAYFGPIDGHNISTLCEVFENAKTLDKPVVIHVRTKKGKGYVPAEENPNVYHGVSKFNPYDFEIDSDDKIAACDYSKTMGTHLCELAKSDPKIAAVTAAMSNGTGLYEFSQLFPRRFFDVGIAEPHAVTFCAAMADNGMRPVFAVYSSFLQRTYDQLLIDCARDKLHIVLAVDRSGFVGEDGETHQGLFDISILSTIPGMTVLCPDGFEELKVCMSHAIYQINGPVAVRYPKGTDCSVQPSPEYDRYNCIMNGRSAFIHPKAVPMPNQKQGKISDFTLFKKKNNDSKTLIVSYGRVFSQCVQAAELLDSDGIQTDLLKLLKVTPLNPSVAEICSAYDNIFIFEEGIKNGGIAQQLACMLAVGNNRANLNITAVDSVFVAQGSVNQQLEQYGLDYKNIYEKIKTYHEKK